MSPSGPIERNPEARPSRSAQRRQALDVLALAKQLVELPPSRAGRLELPDDVREEIAIVRGIPSHIARKRQLGHLAKLMRAHDEQTFDAARAALANEHAAGAREAAATHRLEALRERLLAEGDTALNGLIAEYPDADRRQLRALIRQARGEREADKPPRAQRELFRLLKALSPAGDPTRTR